MLHKKRLVIAGVLFVATIAIVIAVATVAYILFLRPSSKTVAMYGATAVGVPNGPATTKSIGPVGGSIASPDGRITVDVPPNAVPGPVNFSIQPITNLAQGGLGNAYRLEPAGRTFAMPVKVSFKYDAQDLEGTVPESFAVAYQDATGVWQAFKTAHIDQANKAITVPTTHFTDWSFMAAYRLIPTRMTLRVGQTGWIDFAHCDRVSHGIVNWLLGREFCSSEKHAWWESYNRAPRIWTCNYGKVVPSGSGAEYTAPAKRPQSGMDAVHFNYQLTNSETGDSIDGSFVCLITIVERGYRASGESHDVVYSGVICDLEKPFTVNATGLANFDFKFVPSGPTKGAEGTVSYSSTYYPGGVPVVEGGSGSYQVEGIDTDKPRIILTLNSKATGTLTSRRLTVRVPRAMAGTVAINLTPAESECDKK